MDSWYQIENVDEIPSPALIVYPDRVAENLKRMVRMVDDPAKLRPHVKTHKLPQIIRMKRKLGITKFKTSTIAEAEMTASAGGQDILLAYQPVGPNIRRFTALVQAFPDTRFSTLVDNFETLTRLQQAAKDSRTIFELFIDIDVGQHRTGTPVGPHVLDLYQAIVDDEQTLARGLHAYDGHLKNRDHERLCRQVDETFQPVWKLVEEIENRFGSIPTLVAGGTPTSAILAKQANIEVGLGTSVFWDYGYSVACPDQDFLWSAILLTRVVSRPTPTTLCLDLGHKAVASEMPQPRVHFLDLDDAKPIMHSEEHLVIETERAIEYPPGSVLYTVPYHICPSVALHQAACVVENGRAVDSWPVEARNRKLYI